MPIDASIYGQIQQPRINTPFENLSTIMQLRAQEENMRGLKEQREAIAEQRRAQTEKLAREEEDRRMQGEAIRQGGGVRDQTLTWARTNAPNSVPDLTKFFDTSDEKAAQIKKSKQEIANLEADWLGDIADSVLQHGGTPEALSTGLAYAVEQFPDYAEGAKTLQAHLQGAGPEQVKAILEHVRDTSPSRRVKERPPVNVSPGQQIVDPQTGKVIYSAPEKVVKPASQQEYEYALTQGYTGTYKQYQDEDANRKRPTTDPTVHALAVLKLTEAQEEAARRDGLNKMPTNYRTAIDRVLVNAPGTRRTSIENGFARAWAAGNEAEVKDMIRQAAVETENVDAKNQIRGRQATIASLRDAQDILREMKAKGVPTNILTGTAEDIARKLGTSTNTEYVALANRLAGTLINYRRANTGVQFGEKENAQYQKMFPNYSNTLPVNEALISGLMREMETYDRVYWENKLGKDGADLILSRPKAGSGGVTITSIKEIK